MAVNKEEEEKKSRLWEHFTLGGPESTSPAEKRQRPLQATRAQQILAHLAPAGELDCFNDRYVKGHMLGTGGFATVYEGVRKFDSLKVAIKKVLNEHVEYYSLATRDQVLHIPKEVFFMYKAAGGPERLGQCAAVSLLEWFTLDNMILIVMERPRRSMDLRTYSILHDGLPEDTVRDIMKQLVLALIDLHNKRVFHRDLKTENILIQETDNGIRVRIIDFGCSCGVTAMPYSSFHGTLMYCPPEAVLNESYSDGPTSVWQIGAMAYELLNGDASDFDMIEWLSRKLTFKISHVSKEGKDFVSKCLKINPSKRLSLEELERHPWFLQQDSNKLSC